MTPFTVRMKVTNESIGVPCGKCPACYARRASQWSFRLLQEEKVSSSALFVTLTYDTLHVPITDKGYMSLSKRDLQLFFKRLRKISVNKIKYYAVGEYGGKTMRPHYHIILFNATFVDVEKSWHMGKPHYGTVTGASIGYTLKYISKKSKVPLHQNDDRIKEFALMSKGLGQNYATPEMVRWHKSDLNNRMYCNLTDGKKIAMPRYYKNKIYDEHERKRVGIITRHNMLKEKAILMEQPDYYRNLFEAHKQAFRKMEINSVKNDKI